MEIEVSNFSVEVEQKKPIIFTTKIAEIIDSTDPHKVEVEEVYVDWLVTESI